MAEDKQIIKLNNEFKAQERRFQRAKRKVRKYLNFAEAYNIIMKDAVAEQERINDELKKLTGTGNEELELKVRKINDKLKKLTGTEMMRDDKG